MADDTLTPTDPTSVAPPITAGNEISVIGAPPPVPLSGKTVPMLSPSGTVGDIPKENVSDAVKSGFKVGVSMISPDGKPGVIPMDKVHDAIGSGFHIDDPTLNALSDSSGITGLSSGAGKGMSDTMRGVSTLATGNPDTIGGPKLPPASGISEKIGKAGEAVLEFMLGDEALKGLSLGDKLTKIAPTIQALEQHPALAKVVGGALQGATVGGGEGAVKGAESGNAVSGAVSGAVMGAAGGAIAPTIEAARGVKVTPKNPWAAARNALTGENIQPNLQGGVRQVWDNVATAEKVPKPKPGISVRDMGEQVGDSVLARSKAAYKQIDDATGGRFSGLEKDLKNVNDELKFVTSDTEEQNLLIRKQRLVMQTDQAMDEAATKGVNESTIRQAKFDFKKAQAIYDTNHQIRMSTGGVRPGMKGAAEVPETVDAKKLMNRMNSMYNNGRLQEGIGDDNAEDLIGHSATAQKAARDVARNRKVAAIALPAAATAAGTVYEMSK